MFRFLVRYSPTIWLVILVTILFGTFSYFSLPRESAPDVKIPVVMVTIPYIGVSPADIESLVTIPVENELAGVKDIKKLSSTSAEGISVISLEFEPEVVIEEALQRVRDRVNRAKSKLPEDIEEPSVQEISFSDMPILIVNIAGPVDQEQLKQLGERLEDEVTRIPGVLDTRLSGGLEREIRVRIDPRRMTAMGLSLNDISNAIRNENVNIPGGDVTAGTANFLLRVPGDFTTAADIEGVAIKRVGDRPVFIRDVAQVVDGFAEPETYARMNRQPSVSLAVKKRAGAGIIDIADEVRVVASRHAEGWPEGVEYRVLADQSKAIRAMVSDLENNIITALILVVGVLVFFMGGRNSMFVAFSIPMSMLMSFLVLDLLGMTLNMIVLFSLILALGMLVDNAIVVVENVYRHMEEGKDIVRATVEGTGEVAIPVLSSTATTVAAFFPMVFWQGIMGQFMGYLPKTVIIVLSASFVAAVLLVPILTAAFMKKITQPNLTTEDGQPRNKVMALYKRALEYSIDHRYMSAAAITASLFITFVIYGAFNHGTEFFPNTEPDRAVISVKAPDGTDLETTDRIVRRIESVLAETENVDIFVAETGVASSGGGLMVSSQAQANAATITIDFLPHRNEVSDGQKSRVEITHNTVDNLRKLLQTIPGAEIDVQPEAMGPPVGAPIAVEVSGPDFHRVGEYAQVLRRELAKIEGTTELADDYKVGRPEMRLRIDRGAAKRVGASTVEVANAVRTAVAGATASTLRDGKDEYDIVVEVDPRYKDSLQDVLSLRIPGRTDRSPNTFQVPLSAVARYELAGGSGAIRHVDQELVVTITGDVAEGYNENDVRTRVVARMAELQEKGEVPAGINLRLGGANDEQQESMIFLMKAFGLACALVVAVLVTQFNSYRLPAIIMFTVVLSLVGVLWGLLLTGTSFGVIMTGIGVISLAGVVVNNAIVLLDYVEQLRGEGMETREALVKAGMTRFRPVLLTAITTVLGLVPMALGVSLDFFHFKVLVGGANAEFWGPMAIAVIFGLGFATILTLVMVPTFYSILVDFDEWKKRPINWRKSSLPKPTLPITLGLLGLGLTLPTDALAGKLSLEEAWRAAEANNLDLQIAREQTKQIETLKGQAWSLIGPKVQLQGSFTVNEKAIEVDFSDSFSFVGDLYTRLGWAYQDMFTFGAAGSEAVNPGSGLAWTLAAAQAYQDTLDARLASGEITQAEYDATTAALRGEAVDTSSDSGSAGDPIVIQQKTAFGWNASLIQPLFNGRSLPTLRGSYGMIRATQAQELRIQQQIRMGVTRAFYGLHVAQTYRKLAEQAVVSAKNHQTLTERQVVAGSLPPRARLQSELAVSQANRDLARALEQLEVAALSFKDMTGLDPNSDLVLPETPGAMPTSLETAVDHAEAVRPDLKAANERVFVQERYKAAKAGEWLPTVDARFTYNWTENTGFQGQNGMWMLVFSANWMIWDGGLRIAQAKEEASKHRQALLAAEKQQQTIEQEVRSAWARLERAQAALGATERELALATENLRLAETALQSGASTWLELEDARLGLLAAQIAGLQERMNYDLARYELLLATGDL